MAAAGGWFLLKPAPAKAKRIAVLPFANPARDEAYFADGVAEELRSALSRIGLQVIGRVSSDAVKDLDIKAAARKLDVANVLTGSVLRSPGAVRVAAQLIAGENGAERWAEAYGRRHGGEITIQTDIATSVAETLGIALSQAERIALTLGGTTDAAAHDLFLRARALGDVTGNVESVRQSIVLIDQAIARDPNYADAFRLKARKLRIWALNYAESRADSADKLVQAEAAASRAIALAPGLGSAHVTLALIQADQFNFPIAMRNMRQGLALSPDDPSVARPASIFMQAIGDRNKALDLADRAVALDPLQPANHSRRGEVLFTLRDYPQSIAAHRRALQLAPQRSVSHLEIANCLVLMNRPIEAKAEFEKVPADDPFRLTGEGILAARSGDLAGAVKIVAQMRQLFGATTSYQHAQIYAQARDADRAFAELGSAFRVKDPGLTLVKIDPFLDPIRDDPRYVAVLERLSFITGLRESIHF